MRYHPSFDEFVALAAGASVVPVYRQLVGDTLTPVSAFCKIQEGDWSFLFESVVGGERVGRYSFLGSGPFLRFQAQDQKVQRQTVVAGQPGPCEERTHPDPLRLLEEELTAYRAPHVPGLPRFCGGAVGYAGYDTVRYVERLPHPPRDDRQLPDLCFRLLRPHGHFRPHQQDHCGRGPRPRGRGSSRRVAATIPGGLPTGRSSGGTPATRRGRPAADGHRPVWRGPSAVSIQFRAAGLRGGGGQVQGVHQGRRHFPGGAEPAAADRDARLGRSTSTERCAWSTPVRLCSTSRLARFAWWAPRRRSWSAWRTTA